MSETETTTTTQAPAKKPKTQHRLSLGQTIRLNGWLLAEQTRIEAEQPTAPALAEQAEKALGFTVTRHNASRAAREAGVRIRTALRACPPLAIPGDISARLDALECAFLALRLWTEEAADTIEATKGQLRAIRGDVAQLKAERTAKLGPTVPAPERPLFSTTGQE